MTHEHKQLACNIGLCASLAVIAVTIVLGIATIRADYASQAQLANDPAFQQKVKIAGFVAAIAVSNESAGTANHTKRVAFAQQFAQNADLYVTKLAFGVAADPTITASSNDTAIQTRLNAIWDTYAGQ
jgi:hypothetical protein